MKVYTGYFYINHGKKPSGLGLWFFRFKGCCDGDTQEVPAPHSMPYSEAKKWAKEKAEEIGASTIILLP